LELARRLDAHANIANAQYELARIAREKSDLETAAHLLAESFALREQLGDNSGIAEVLFLQAAVCHDLQEFTQANELALRAISIQEEIGDHRHRIQTWHLLAEIALHGRAAFQEAEEYCRRAIALCNEQQEAAELAQVSSTLAETYRLQGKLQDAYALATKCLELSQRMGSRQLQALYLFRLSKINADLGNLPLALQQGLSSLALCRETHERIAIMYVLEHIGQLYHILHQPAQELQMWREALAVAQELNHPLSTELGERLKFHVDQ
ncbi:MAG TPA: hypothetical protein VMP08_10465, partial [Anaerolineae bacterium]|nr:hypothetical protein [Anaerolineae bacterium]